MNECLLKITSDFSLRYDLAISSKISLDPFPFQGNTTTCESVWMGVPVLTLKGDRYISHFGESINSNLNMKSWIADNKEDYLNKAIELANNQNKINEIKNKILNCKKTDKYFDTKNYTKNLEKIYKTIHKNRIIENKFEDLHL